MTDSNLSLRYSEREIDFAYLAGVFNVSGIDGLQKEIARLKGLGKNPHDIIIAARQSEQLVCDHPDEAIIRDKPTDYCMACNSNI